MRQNQDARELQVREEKVATLTNGGPKLPAREDVIKKFKAKQALTKLNLTKQMEME